MSSSTIQPLRILSVRSEPESIDPNEVPLIVSEVALGQYFQVAVVTALVYDALITLDKEAKYFWKVPQRAVDYVYFLNRYVGIFGSVAFLFWDAYGVDIALSGNFADWTRNIANWVTIISIDYILLIRVLALYSQNTRLSMCLSLLLMLEAVFKLAMMIYLGVIEHIAVGGLAKNVTACGYDNDASWELGAVDWLIPMSYGAILMILALYKAAEYWKMSAGFKGFVLVKVLIRDQVLYFMLVIACFIFAILGFRVVFSNEFLSEVFNALGNPAFLTILGSRMLFNLKEAGERGQNEGISYRAPSRMISDIDFAEPAPPQRESGTGTDGDDGQARPTFRGSSDGIVLIEDPDIDCIHFAEVSCPR